MDNNQQFEALTTSTLPARLGSIDAVNSRVGGDSGTWRVREVGDGNLNLVFIVEGGIGGAVVVKQALPYVRLVGESWPLPLKRSFFEHEALIRQARRDPGRVPEVFHFDRGQALIVMEFLTPHIILRRALIEGQMPAHVPAALGRFAARTLFRGSDLAMETRQRKADLALFADNVELCDITENLVFSDPYFAAEMNRHTAPYLDDLVAELRGDRDLKVEAQRLKHLFAAKAETLLHGDLHTGSVMVSKHDARVIDPEFAVYGPMAFDVGMLLANFWMSYFSQSGHEKNEPRHEMRRWLLAAIDEIWSVFCQEFASLWRTERRGILYQASLFEDQGDMLAAEQALSAVLHDIWTDMLGFAGIEMHRRVLGLAHNADFETIEEPKLRADCEAKALKLGRYLVVNRCNIVSIDHVNELAQSLESGAAR